MLYLLGAIALFFLFFLVIHIISSIRYRPTKDEIKNILQNAIDGKVNLNQWDTFISVPIRHDNDLEEIRRQCIEFNAQGKYFSNNKNSFFNELGTEELKKILQRIS